MTGKFAWKNGNRKRKTSDFQRDGFFLSSFCYLCSWLLFLLLYSNACLLSFFTHAKRISISSLVANLAAAEKFQASFLQKPENWKYVEEAQYYYFGSFFITHDGGYQSALLVSEHAAKNNKTFALNLSAPFLSQFFKERLDSIIKNTDILFGNEDEARTYSQQMNWGTDDIEEIAKKLSQLEKSNDKPRLVVITHGAQSTITAIGNVSNSYPVIKVAESEIVDTNGCGDGFCGGFMGLYAQGVHDAARCVQAGHYLANLVIKRIGPSYPPMAERTNVPSF